MRGTSLHLALILLFVTLAMLAMTPSPSSAQPVQDGVIDDGEYDHRLSTAGGDMEIHWTVANGTVSFGLKGRTTGWVAIGLEPTTIMKDADMYFGWSSGGNARAEDAWSTGNFGPHPRDTDQGGSFDIDGYDVGEASGWTTFEFRRALDTGDGKDRKVPASGKLDIIWATGANDNWNQQHTRRGSATIDTGTGDAEVDEGFPGWSLHAILMTVGVLLMFYGFTLVRKKERGWMEHHRRVMTAAAVLAGLGLLFGMGAVVQGGGPHLRLPHTWIGAVTLFVVTLTLIQGYQYRKATSKKRGRMRNTKIWLGRASLALMVLTMVLGVITVVLGL